MAHNTLINLNKIELITSLGYVLKTLKLIIIITNVSYFLGIFWFFFYDYEEDYAEMSGNSLDNHFMYYYDIVGNKANYEQIIILTYYSFTTLSTVGFGDYAPVSNSERVMGSFILLFGVAIFSYIMGCFMEIIDQLRSLNNEPNEGEKLECFFNMFQRFNSGHPIKAKVVENIREHFDYKWNNDRN